MSSTEIGKNAEKRVAEELHRSGHKIISMNWRTRWCEIDIVSTKDGCVFFTEVKYRSSNDWGDGLSYITPQKVKQMNFAAQFWMHENNWIGDALLLGASVAPDDTIEFVEIS
jgi:Holliday junction resolvase-like predicted endonuclease